METLIYLFGSMMVFNYHCFDRIVINSYLSMLSHTGSIVYFFQQVKGVSCITPNVLSARTKYYQSWVEAFAKNHDIPIMWAEKGVRKDQFARQYLKKMGRSNKSRVYLVLKSMEQETTFRSVEPKFPNGDPNYRIIKKTRKPFTHYYFYLTDETLGPMSLRVGSYLPFKVTSYLNGHNFIERELTRLGVNFRKKENAIVFSSDPQSVQDACDRLTPEIIQGRLDYWIYVLGPKFSKHERAGMNLRRFHAINQIEYCQNMVFKRNFPIRRLFLRSCELGLITLTADKIINIFGHRVTRRFNGKLQTVFDQVYQGRHVLRSYYKKSFVKQYEKFRTLLRMEVVSNNVYDLAIKKSLVNLPLVREASLKILDRFADTQAFSLNAHFDFPMIEQLAKAVNIGKTRVAGIKIHDARMVRLMETLMRLSVEINGWTSRMIHDEILKKHDDRDYSINQLRYDIRKMKAHGLVERNGKRYSYRLTKKGKKVSTLFVLFHKRIFGPLANSLFKYKPDDKFIHESTLEKAYHEADSSIDKIIDLLAA